MSDRLICGFEVHEAATLFPLITGPDFDAMVEDIRQNGQLDPIVLDDEMRIIDGRNRARACERLGIKPMTTRYDGDDVVAYVVSHNLHRRHLTDSQRAMIAAKLATAGEGRPPKLGDITQFPTQKDAAKLLRVGVESVKAAKVVHRQGTPELQKLVEEGHTPVNTAVRVAVNLDPQEQNDYVEKVRAGADAVKSAPPPLAQREREARRARAIRSRDEFHRNTRHINAEQVVENTISALEGVALGLSVVKGQIGSLDAEKRLAWIEALREPLSAINAFKKELAS